MDDFFLVTSYGRTATYWIAANLHKHPDIACNHGPSLSLSSLDYSGKQVSGEVALDIHKNISGFHNALLMDVFDFVKKNKKAKYIGNVHGYAASSVRAIQSMCPELEAVKVANITRHPLHRIESQKNRLLKEVKHDKYLLDMFLHSFDTFVDSSIIDNLMSKYNIDLSCIYNKVYLYSASLIPYHDDLDYSANYTNFTMERLLNDRDYFVNFIHYITGYNVELSHDYISNVFASGKMNESDRVDETAYDMFQNWPEWLKYTCSLIFQKYNIVNKYAMLGYDIGYISSQEKCIRSFYVDCMADTAIQAPPVLVEYYKEFGIVFYNNLYYGCPNVLGAVYIDKIKDRQKPGIFMGESIEQIHYIIDLLT